MRVVLLLLAMTGLAHATDAQQIERARSAVLTDDYQRRMPDAPDEDTTSAAPQPADVDAPPQDPEASPLSNVLNLVLWGLTIVTVGIFAFWMASELIKYGDEDAALAAEAEADPAERARNVIERPLGDAEECARRGDYAEAIHTLLLRTMQELARSSALRISPAYTSREILARVRLLPDAREALAGLITAVELTHFGADLATSEDYDRCRAQFQKFATAFRSAT